ncbi:hypothetical protein SAMN04487947_0272 [Halogeometricum rufum]|jgi:hypothetical protein|uniref:Uncharacterized protein n=1 Tax=Halogeometricum rufum TaxID=553469 RepID=A0A1I6FYX0_9EURY|nr:hypothetical protein [Halogeometricum rufum]SFR35138.1 hypothetical protein SAMN04487947_0272 [Halogeometricum rufum]
MPFSPPGGVAFAAVVAVAFGGAVGLVAGLFTLPFAAAGRVRDALSVGPTPEWLPNLLLSAAVGGMSFAAVQFGLRWADAIRLVSAGQRDALVFVSGGALALFAAVSLLARGYQSVSERESQRGVGLGGAVLLLSTGVTYGLATTVLSLVA